MIDVNNLTLQYPDGHLAVRDLTFHLASGESAALLGANGAGKSSLFRALLGLLPAKAGSVTMGSLPLSKKNLNQIRERSGLLFQNPDDQLFSPRVRDDVAFGLRRLGLSHEEVENRVDRILEALHISYLAERSPQRLSAGEKRRVAIAGVLVTEPEVLLFDEPTSQLDPRSRRELMELLNRLPQTKLIATHDLELARNCCARTLILKEGELAASGETAALLTDRELLFSCGLA